MQQDIREASESASEASSPRESQMQPPTIVSIVDFDPTQEFQGKDFLDSPRSVEACLRVGVLQQQLLRRSPKKVKPPPEFQGDAELYNSILQENHEFKRQQYVQLVIQERGNLLYKEEVDKKTEQEKLKTEQEKLKTEPTEKLYKYPFYWAFKGQQSSEYKYVEDLNKSETTHRKQPRQLSEPPSQKYKVAQNDVHCNFKQSHRHHHKGARVVRVDPEREAQREEKEARVLELKEEQYRKHEQHISTIVAKQQRTEQQIRAIRMQRDKQIRQKQQAEHKKMELIKQNLEDKDHYYNVRSKHTKEKLDESTQGAIERRQKWLLEQRRHLINEHLKEGNASENVERMRRAELYRNQQYYDQLECERMMQLQEQMQYSKFLRIMDRPYQFSDRKPGDTFQKDNSLPQIQRSDERVPSAGKQRPKNYSYTSFQSSSTNPYRSQHAKHECADSRKRHVTDKSGSVTARQNESPTPTSQRNQLTKTEPLPRDAKQPFTSNGTNASDPNMANYGTNYGTNATNGSAGKSPLLQHLMLKPPDSDQRSVQSNDPLKDPAYKNYVVVPEELLPAPRVLDELEMENFDYFNKLYEKFQMYLLEQNILDAGTMDIFDFSERFSNVLIRDHQKNQQAIQRRANLYQLY